MISAEMLMNGLGMFFILCSAYLVVILILRKSIWNYPPIVSMYIFLAIFLLFCGIVTIKQIEITTTIDILILVSIIIWGYIMFRLPARKEEIDEIAQRIK